jgi:ABC-type multidrug transport system permease subunit
MDPINTKMTDTKIPYYSKVGLDQPGAVFVAGYAFAASSFLISVASITGNPLNVPTYITWGVLFVPLVVGIAAIRLMGNKNQKSETLPQ